MLRFVAILFTAIFVVACGSSPPVKQSNFKTLVLNGQSYEKEVFKSLVSWHCRSFSNKPLVQVEVGLLDKEKLSDIGFILYDGSNSGDVTKFDHTGIGQIWFWGGENGKDYSFVLKEDNTGTFYNLGAAKVDKPDLVNKRYRCEKL